MAEEPKCGDTIELGVFRDTTIMRGLEGGLTRDKNLSQARRLIETEGSAAGVVTTEELQKLLNNADFCKIFFNLFNEGGEKPLDQSHWFDKMKVWTEVVIISQSFDGSMYRNVLGDTRSNTDEGAAEEGGARGLD